MKIYEVSKEQWQELRNKCMSRDNKADEDFAKRLMKDRTKFLGKKSKKFKRPMSDVQVVYVKKHPYSVHA